MTMPHPYEADSYVHFLIVKGSMKFFSGFVLEIGGAHLANLPHQTGETTTQPSSQMIQLCQFMGFNEIATCPSIMNDHAECR